MRGKKYERGQAIGELMIGLIGFCAVMIGLLAVALLGMTGVRNTIAAREKADRCSMSGIENGSPEEISTWNNGPDGLPFTQDDVRVKGVSVNPEFFLGELTDHSGTFRTAQLAQTEYAENSLESKVAESLLFLSAARLTSAREVVADPLSLYRHFDAARILRAFGFTSVFTVEDTISMPVNPME